MFTLRVKKMILSQKYQNFRKNTTFVPLPIRRNNMKLGYSMRKVFWRIKAMNAFQSYWHIPSPGFIIVTIITNYIYWIFVRQ